MGAAGAPAGGSAARGLPHCALKRLRPSPTCTLTRKRNPYSLPSLPTLQLLTDPAQQERISGVHAAMSAAAGSLLPPEHWGGPRTQCAAALIFGALLFGGVLPTYLVGVGAVGDGSQSVHHSPDSAEEEEGEEEGAGSESDGDGGDDEDAAAQPPPALPASPFPSGPHLVPWIPVVATATWLLAAVLAAATT